LIKSKSSTEFLKIESFTGTKLLVKGRRLLVLTKSKILLKAKIVGLVLEIFKVSCSFPHSRLIASCLPLESGITIFSPKTNAS